MKSILKLIKYWFPKKSGLYISQAQELKETGENFYCKLCGNINQNHDSFAPIYALAGMMCRCPENRHAANERMKYALSDDLKFSREDNAEIIDAINDFNRRR